MIIVLMILAVSGIIATGQPVKNTTPAPQEWVRPIGPQQR